MHYARLRQIAYAVCMASSVLLTAAFSLYEAVFPLPERYTSAQAASTVPPITGFVADSVFNTGDVQALDALPAVGEVIAQRIIDLRPIINGYRIPEDLLLVKGIGEKTLDKIMQAFPETIEPLPSD